MAGIALDLASPRTTGDVRYRACLHPSNSLVMIPSLRSRLRTFALLAVPLAALASIACEEEPVESVGGSHSATQTAEPGESDSGMHNTVRTQGRTVLSTNLTAISLSPIEWESLVDLDADRFYVVTTFPEHREQLTEEYVFIEGVGCRGAPHPDGSGTIWVSLDELAAWITAEFGDLADRVPEESSPEPEESLAESFSNFIAQFAGVVADPGDLVVEDLGSKAGLSHYRVVGDRSEADGWHVHGEWEVTTTTADFWLDANGRLMRLRLLEEGISDNWGNQGSAETEAELIYGEPVDIQPPAPDRLISPEEMTNLGPANPQSVGVDALFKTVEAETARFTMRVLVPTLGFDSDDRPAADNSLEITGTVDFPSGATKIEAIVGEAAEAMGAPVLVVAGVAYNRVLGPDGAELGWIEHDLIDLALTFFSPIFFDLAVPTTLVDLIEKAQEASEIEDLGSESIWGVDATRYRASIEGDDPDDQVRGVPPAYRSTVDFWVDGEGRLIAVDYVLDREGDGVTDRALRIELFDFGEPESLSAPPADQIVSEEELAALRAGG